MEARGGGTIARTTAAAKKLPAFTVPDPSSTSSDDSQQGFDTDHNRSDRDHSFYLHPARGRASSSDRNRLSELHPAMGRASSGPLTLLCAVLVGGLSLYAVGALCGVLPSGFGDNTAGDAHLFVVGRVWWSSWLTAAFTGLGIIPFAFSSGDLGPYWLALCNAAAAGMMLAASGMLLVEGGSSLHGGAALDAAGQLMGRDSDHAATLLGWLAHRSDVRCAVGCAAGVLFLYLSKRWLDGVEHVRFSAFDGASGTRRHSVAVIIRLSALAPLMSI